MHVHVHVHCIVTLMHIHSTMEDGLLPALTYRYTARLHATFSLLTLSLPTHSEDDKTLVDLLQGILTVIHVDLYDMPCRFFFSEVCSENSSEDNLETLSSNLPTKEYVIPQGEVGLCEVTSGSPFHFNYACSFSSSLPLSFPPLPLSSLPLRCLLSSPRSLPLAGGDGHQGGVCHSQGKH